MIFFVYTGHGVEKCSETHALMSDGKKTINLKSFMNKCAKKYITVLSVLDCSREIITGTA